MEFSRQEYWSGFPFPSPGDLPNPGIKPGFPALQANSLPSEPPPESPALEDRFLNTGPPGNSPKTFSKVRKLQAWTHYIYTYMSMCMCVLVSQSYPTLCDSSDCNSPGSSVHGDSPGKNTGVGSHALLQGIFPTQGSNPGLPHDRWIFYHLCHLWTNSFQNF